MTSSYWSVKKWVDLIYAVAAGLVLLCVLLAAATGERFATIVVWCILAALIISTTVRRLQWCDKPVWRVATTVGRTISAFIIVTSIPKLSGVISFLFLISWLYAILIQLIDFDKAIAIETIDMPLQLEAFQFHNMEYFEIALIFYVVTLPLLTVFVSFAILVSLVCMVIATLYIDSLRRR